MVNGSKIISPSKVSEFTPELNELEGTIKHDNYYAHHYNVYTS